MNDVRRLTEWIDCAADLLNDARPVLPREELAVQLRRSFDVVAVAWESRDELGHSRFQMYSDHGTEVVNQLLEWHTADLLDRHPLIRWYNATQNPAPQTLSRVPSSVAPARDQRLVGELLRPFEVDQQLSIPYDVGGESYGAFVLGRTRDDFDDGDLELAQHLQRLLQAIYRRTVATQGRHHERVVAAAREAGLTQTELAVLTLLAEGHTAYSIGRRLSMSPRTASKHSGRIYRKLGVSDRLTAVLVAQEAGLVRSPSLLLSGAHPS